MDIARHRIRAAAAVATVVTATAFTQVAAAQPAAAAVPGLQVVSVATPGDSTSPKTVVASCPTGKRVVGTGFFIDGDASQVVLDDLAPTATSVLVTGYEDQDGTTGTWWIRAFAICADPLPGWEIITASSASNSVSKSAVANCSSGKRTLGGGAIVSGGTGQVVIDAMLPGSVGVTSTAYEDFDGTAANWTLTSYAICAYAPPGLQVVSATSFPDTSDQGVWVTCPGGTTPLGLGWDINSRISGSIFPEVAMPSPTEAVIAAKVNNMPLLVSWSITGRAVCATP